MGMYDDLKIDKNLSLPEFEGDRKEISWQSRNIRDPSLGTFRLSHNGLEKLDQEQEYTEEWSKFLEANNLDSHTEALVEGNYHEGPDGPIMNVVNETWEDTEYHGSFQFRGSTDNHRYTYEARFTDGDLDKVMLIEKQEK